MAAEKADAGWLWEMLDAAHAVAQFVDDKSLAEYEADLMFAAVGSRLPR